MLFFLYQKYFGDGRSQGAVIQETSNFCQVLGSELPLAAEPTVRTAVRKSGGLSMELPLTAGIASSADNDILRDEHYSCRELRSMHRALMSSVEGPKEELSIFILIIVIQRIF